MELFDKQFVRFMWDDELKGKKCFVSDYVDDLKGFVERDKSDMCLEVVGKGTANYPFEVLNVDSNKRSSYQFVYHDPNFGVKKAFNEGKKVQVRDPATDDWVDCVEPLWCAGLEYREKPKCPCDAGVDSKACVGCPQSEDGKKKWRPYKNSAEMIADFIARFKVNCPSYAEPLVWVKHKRHADNGHLITDFFHGAGVRVCGSFFSFEALLYEYTYLDGSPCGMEVKE